MANSICPLIFWLSSGVRSLLVAGMVTMLPASVLAAELLVSTSPDRSNPVLVDSQTHDGVVYVFLDGADSADRVQFYLDGVLVKTEGNPPWDLAGTRPDDLALPFDTRDLLDGNYELKASVSQGGGNQQVTADFRIANQPPPAGGGDAQHLHFGWQGDPATTLSVVWFSELASNPAQVSYRLAGTSNWTVVNGALRMTTADGRYLAGHLSGLLPDTAYEVRVSLGQGVWSRVYRTATVPATGPGDFDAVYVADTGLIGRLDGLANGTEAVIAAIADLGPDFVLLGGDYAYFDTDKRYGTLARTIGAWFDQMAPIASQAPMMPAYGNHEVLLGEGFDTWVRYFPTPDGWNQRRMYSFDIGDVHFVSVWGLHESQQLPQDGLAWLVDDLAQARARGQRWLIPFFHAAPFSEGTNHPSALKLRQQLGPVFEEAGVQLVLTAHDQSFERTYPLVDVPANNTPTSSARHCYSLADGVTWLKVSPGGKMSNISGDFSPWRTPTPPNWTAVRDNTRHHFAHLEVSADGELVVTVYGIDGEGAPPWRRDRVRYTTGGCGPEPVANPAQVSFVLEPGESDSQTVQVTANGGPVAVAVRQRPPWLGVSPGSGVTPLSVSLNADASGLALGRYHGMLEIGEADNLDRTTWLPVTLLVGGADVGLWVSDNAQRTSARRLEGTTLQGDSYIFSLPDTGVSQARFYLDDPGGNGSPAQVENRPPFDFAGTAPDSSAIAFDTTTLADGAHSIDVKVDLAGNVTQAASAQFQVLNDAPQLAFSANPVAMQVVAPATISETQVLAEMTDGQLVGYTAVSQATWLEVDPPAGNLPQTLVLRADTSGLAIGQYQGQVQVDAATGPQATLIVNLSYGAASPYALQVSTQSDRSSPMALDGASLSGDVYIFVPHLAGITRVRFYLDDPNRQGAPYKVEGNAPWDFAGTNTAPPRLAMPFDASALSGVHTVTAVVDHQDGSTVIHASFEAVP